MRSKDQTGRDGHGKSVVTDPLGIPVMFNLKCLIKLTQKKIYHARYSPTSRRATINLLPSFKNVNRMCSITGRILKNLRVTISGGKDMNFPE